MTQHLHYRSLHGFYLRVGYVCCCGLDCVLYFGRAFASVLGFVLSLVGDAVYIAALSHAVLLTPAVQSTGPGRLV